jgi:DNA-binding response OmpR family regulator
LNLGSTFAVYLPAAAVDEPLVARRPMSGPRRTMPALDASSAVAPDVPVVLVVEDDVHIATVLRTYLEADGYRVVVAEDGQAAVQLAHELQPFAVTLDISLPRLDGWSVLNSLKRDPETSTIPVVVVSIVDNRDFGLVLGAAEYLVKPIDPDRLRGVLHSLNGAHVSW